MSEYEQVIDEIVKHGVVVKVNKIVDDNYIPYERKYVGCVVELDFSEHDKKVLEENLFKIKMHKDPLDMSFEIDGKTHSAYSLVNGIEYCENIIKAQSKEKDSLEARISELEKICDNRYDENKALKKRITELESKETETSSEIDTSTPINCANSLISHLTHLEAFLIAPERYERTFDIDDLEQIAEHLLVYCKHNKETE